ncbi:MAG TPA: 3-hydroxyacyl-CoA dehydrogenase family protein [Promineifilum sp.]|nr:3-hydroxyacyl-CoA dehydrogenase family protein [Promineifilum sp.]
MNVIIVGETPFVDEIGRLCRAAGHVTERLPGRAFLAEGQAGDERQKLAAAEVVIAAQDTSAAAKRAVLMALSVGVPEEALLLTLALATSVTTAAAWVRSPERVVGFGVVPPLPDEGIVELAAALQTTTGALAQAEEFWRGLKQEPVRVADGPGLVRARTVCCLINEAASVLMEEVAVAADIDLAMRLGTNYPHGPLAWADRIGLDVVLGVMTGLFDEWGDDHYRPAPLLRRMVAAGWLGRKSGRGFYLYPDEAG